MNPTDSSSKKRQRLETRVSAEQKELFLRAAHLRGQTLSDFIVSSLQAAAQDIMREHEMIPLTARDSAAFVDALMNPAEPTEKLSRAAMRYRAFVRE